MAYAIGGFFIVSEPTYRGGGLGWRRAVWRHANCHKIDYGARSHTWSAIIAVERVHGLTSFLTTTIDR